MKEDLIIKQLSGLKSIEPNQDYAASSKLKLIYQTPQKTGPMFAFSQSLSASLSMGLVMVLFIFVAIGGVSNILRSPLSPVFNGVSEELVAEAGEVNDAIDIHLEEVKYLTDITNNSLVQATIEKTDISNSADEEIDNLLSEAKDL
ncbi:MAG: hypothetical protein ABH880_01925 [Patescibacteria group bacterium]